MSKAAFADIARSIGDARLGNVLAALAIQIETDIHNAQVAPKKSIRGDISKLRKAAETFLRASSHLSLLNLPLDQPLSDRGPEEPGAITMMKQVLAFCDKFLQPGRTAKKGRAKIAGRTVCASIVIEAWNAVHGHFPSASNSTVQSICDDYWQASGNDPIGELEPAKWRRSISDALLSDNAFRKYVRHEIALRTK